MNGSLEDKCHDSPPKKNQPKGTWLQFSESKAWQHFWLTRAIRLVVFQQERSSCFALGKLLGISIKHKDSGYHSPEMASRSQSSCCQAENGLGQPPPRTPHQLEPMVVESSLPFYSRSSATSHSLRAGSVSCWNCTKKEVQSSSQELYQQRGLLRRKSHQNFIFITVAGFGKLIYACTWYFKM